MKNVKHHIALFYVALFLMFKVSGLHAFTHHADDSDVQHCEVCHITTTIGFVPLLEADILVIPQTDSFFAEQKDNAKTVHFVHNNKHLANYLFARPPPQLP